MTDRASDLKREARGQKKARATVRGAHMPEVPAGGEGRCWGRGRGDSWDPLHTADNQQQLGHALQVETVRGVLGDMPCLRGTCGENKEAITMVAHASPGCCDSGHAQSFTE